MNSETQKYELRDLTILAAIFSRGVTLIEDSNGYRYTDTYVDGKLVLRTQRGLTPEARAVTERGHHA